MSSSKQFLGVGLLCILLIFPGIESNASCQSTTATLGSSAIQIVPSSRTAPLLPPSGHQGTSTVSWSSIDSMILILTSYTVREPQGNSWLFTPSFPCVRPQHVGTSHQSETITALAGVISRRFLFYQRVVVRYLIR